MAEIAVGIDLGTSNSCVAVARKRKVEVLPNAYGESTTASVVNLGADGSITVGNAAKANVIHDPTNTISSSKRLIGRYFFSEEVKKAKAICSYDIVEGENHSVRIKVREEVFSLPEISAMVLRELKSIGESRVGQPVNKAVVTVPAYFNDNQRQATKDAARIAGLEVLRILNEPTAAALAYGFGKGLNQKVAVYDLGGGTFDISVLEIGEDVFEVLSTSGDTFLGGDDFDDRIIDLLADEFSAKEGINLRNDPFALEKLKVAAEDAKKAFSVDDEVEIRIPDIVTTPDGASRSIERTVTKQEFWNLVSDLVQRTFKVCDEALQEAGVIARDLDGVILVGGPTRLPTIRTAVKEYFQQEPKDDVDPDEVVAMGAAIHAASLLDQGGDAYLLDVTPLSLQMGVAGDLCEPIIERNTPVPIEQTRVFTTARDDQESVSIKVYQGEARELDDNELLGQFEFSGFQRGRRGEVQIDVTFEINTDGIVNVTASDKTTGQQASTRISLSSGLSEGEIRDIVSRGVADRVQTAEADDDGAPGGEMPALEGAAPAAAIDPVAELFGEDPDDDPGDPIMAEATPEPLVTEPVMESAPETAMPEPIVAEPTAAAEEVELAPEPEAAAVPSIVVTDDAPDLEIDDDLAGAPELEIDEDLLSPSAESAPAVEVEASEAVTSAALEEDAEPSGPAPLLTPAPSETLDVDPDAVTQPDEPDLLEATPDVQTPTDSPMADDVVIEPEEIELDIEVDASELDALVGDAEEAGTLFGDISENLAGSDEEAK
ncbi:MAG: Hsp70 family protein [Myxococcota bacterium]